MQISEDLIKQITNAVLQEMGQSANSTSLVGKDRINPKRTSYANYKKAAKGTNPKEVVIGVGAAFQREIKRTICNIPLDEARSQFIAALSVWLSSISLPIRLMIVDLAFYPVLSLYFPYN